jgi:Domain of unknown function DUF11/Putative metal-binding motif
MFRRLIITLPVLLIFLLIVFASGRADNTPSSRAITADSGLRLLPSEEITYTSFSGTTYNLNAYSGKYVRYALPDSWTGAGGLSPMEVAQFVDSADLLYAQMKEVVGGEPNGDGLLLIAVVDTGSHAGLVEIGSKRAELSQAILNDTKSYLAKGLVSEIIIHQMAHCFDIYHSYLSYYNDWGHAWTALLIPYMQVYSRSGSLTLGPDELLNKTIQDYTAPWYGSGSRATWGNCVGNGGGCEADGVKANEAWAGMVLQYTRLHGPLALKRAMLYLKDYKAAHADVPSTPEAKNDLLITALATGTGANVSCEMDAWRWSLTDSERANLAQSFPANASCADADGDGYSPLQGDFDDHNANVRPGAVETVNGIDDDCNGVIDDVLVKESTDFGGDAQTAQVLPIPSRIQGRAATNDRDVFRIEVTSPLQLDIEGKSADSFHGTLIVASADGLGNSTGFSISAGQTARATFTLERPGSWLLTILPDAGGEGDYEVKIARSQPLLNPVQLSLSPGTTPGTVRIQASVDTSRQFNTPPTHIRFWIGNEGFIKTLPVASSLSFEWTPASRWTIPVRAQILSGEIPISRATDPAWFDPSTSQPVNTHTADLVLISRTSVPPAVKSDQPLVYAFEVRNMGPDVADDVQATVTLGQGLRASSTATTRGTASQSGSTITFTVGPVASGESIGINVSADPAQATGAVMTSAMISTTSTDLNQSNNSASWSTSITPAPAASPFFGLPLKSADSPNLHILPESGMARALAVLPGTSLDASYARADEYGKWPTTLNGVTVSVGGRPAQVIAVTRNEGFTSSTPVYRVDFAVPVDAPVGAGVTITVTHAPSGSAWNAVAEVKTLPTLWASNGTSTGPAIAQDADTFLTIRPERPARASSQTRVTLYATGLRSLIISNSLVVRARSSDGRVFVLPIDYAGAGKILPGMDQIIVRLTPELVGAGQVILTIDAAADSQISLPVQ